MNAKFQSEVSAVDADVVITRTLRAPRELVFQAWTDPEHVGQWWGPNGFSVPEMRNGCSRRGAFTEMLGPDGVTYPCDGTYREVVALERIVHDGIAAEGHPCGAGLPPHGRVTITFTEQAGLTTVRVHAKLRSQADREAAMEAGFGTGWAQTLERLDAHLSNEVA